MKYSFIYIVVLFGVFVSCDKIVVPESQKPSADSLIKILTLTPQNPVANQASAGGDISDDGGEDIIERGVCWAVHDNPTLKDSVRTEGRGTGIYRISINNLFPGRRYFLKAYAKNKYGTVYGNRTSFSVGAAKPQLAYKSDTATDVSVHITFYVRSGGGYPVTEQGVYFDTVGSPVQSGKKIISSLQSDTFTVTVSGLTPKTRYSFTPFAVNQVGTQIGPSSYTVQTKIFAAPLVTTNGPTAVTQTSMTVGGNIVSMSSDGIHYRGIIYDTLPPVSINSGSTVNSGNGPGSFSITLLGLKRKTLYYARAFAQTSEGPVLGSVVSATTAP